jgi:hypothetical protein
LILVIVSLTVPRILISFLRCHHPKRRSVSETLLSQNCALISVVTQRFHHR